MSRVFIDTNIPMYAAGADHPLRGPARRVILSVATGRLDAVTDTEVFQEILYRYLHLGEREKGFRVFDHFYRIMMGRVLPIEDEDVQQARIQAERYPALSPRDLIHLAVVLRHGLEEMITTDTGFDFVKEVRRLDPTDFVSPG
ncbi:MAG: type II toxin-antitoxin system VapC family toxin [Acidobacteria bacterium]|nr:type II toxin-antitoxin system VapC family toxin [Acidobacteriota bacterium]